MLKKQMIPATGGFYAWKKVYRCGGRIWDCGRYHQCLGAPVILKLWIPAHASRRQEPPTVYRHRSVPFHVKARVSVVRVVAAYSFKTGKQLIRADTYISSHDRMFKYKVGETILPRRFSYTSAACAPGIHIFRLRDDAERWW